MVVNIILLMTKSVLLWRDLTRLKSAYGSMRFGHIMQNFCHVAATDEPQQQIPQRKTDYLRSTKDQRLMKIRVILMLIIDEM